MITTELDTFATAAGTDVGAAKKWMQAGGWRDLEGQFNVKSSGVDRPTFAVTLNGLYGYRWSPTTMQWEAIDFHLGHDYKAGTKVYPHVHFRPILNSSGVVRWGFTYTASKGHGQQAGMPIPVTVYKEFTVPLNSAGTHFIAELDIVDAIPATYLEPDAVIHMTVFRDATHANDTYPADVWAWQCDLHYQTDRYATLNKAPNFYA